MAKHKYEPAVDLPVEDPADIPFDATSYVDETEVEHNAAPLRKRTIQVLRHYQGRRTNEQVIRPGAYYDDDPELHGLADYLLENGYARLG